MKIFALAALVLVAVSPAAFAKPKPLTKAEVAEIRKRCQTQTGVDRCIKNATKCMESFDKGDTPPPCWGRVGALFEHGG